MHATVALPEIIDAMQSQSDERTFYLDHLTGRIEMVADEDIVGEDDEMTAIIEAIDDDTEGRFVPLPDAFDIHEWEMMKEFAEQLDDAAVGGVLLDAIQGRGAFRSFKNKIHEFDVSRQWYAFRDDRYLQIAIDWCQANGIEYHEDRSQ